MKKELTKQRNVERVHIMNVQMNNDNDKDKWKLCNDMIGRILTYLDEEDVRRAVKMAVKSEIWNFFNVAVENENEQENSGNR